MNVIKAENDVHKRDSSHNPMNGTTIEIGGKWINCEELYRIMTNDSCEILLLDCRNYEEYKESRIDFKNIINIPNLRKG